VGRTTAQADEDAPVDGGSDGRDDVIVAALASGSSYADAANLAGVSTRTVARRMADPAFAGEVVERRRQHFGVIADSLLAGAPDAVAVIRDVMMNAERPADQLKAAVILLGEARRLHQLMDVDTRLRKILRLLETSDDTEDSEHAEDTGS
jgi:hypothetical protein